MLLRSAYDTLEDNLSRKERHPLFTNFTSRFSATLDYILVDDSNVKVTKVLEVPDKVEPMPNKAYPSDHVRLEAVLEIL